MTTRRTDARQVKAGDLINIWTQICPVLARVHRVRLVPGNLRLQVVEILSRRLTDNSWVQIERIVGSQVHVMEET